MSTPPVRSLLFVPGNRTGWVAKGVDAGADGVILDLEDAVPSGAKSDARAEVAGFLGETPPAVPVVVRVNGLHDRAALDDLCAVVGPALTAVMVPKVESVADVHVVDRLLGWLEADLGLPVGGIHLVPVLETAAGIRQAHDLARATPRSAYMGGLGVKGGDVERSLGYRWTPEGIETLALRAQVLVDLRAAAVPNPVAGLWTDIRDLDGLRAFARQNRGLGYEGMLAIHPTHVAVINEVFTPTEAELDADAALVAAMESAAAEGRGAVRHGGDMIDEAMAETARRRLARYRP
ncbi:Citryl-CoA lyase [Frankia canadensis]|uniref:Citryl-CoA lyase n=1 Tax=Frankia canadensis TaxID=1836972 RepID=A0A2I2KLT3_9ACTN|nr:CoA ester lyase [Frankia canadensis]SNQ46624.1 Citryl-CoA lyase [Frankia canadensis]SOU53914.1 Citryl-CoA lyase [Frankia canadensis]